MICQFLGRTGYYEINFTETSELHILVNRNCMPIGISLFCYYLSAAVSLKICDYASWVTKYQSLAYGSTCFLYVPYFLLYIHMYIYIYIYKIVFFVSVAERYANFHKAEKGWRTNWWNTLWKNSEFHFFGILAQIIWERSIERKTLLKYMTICFLEVQGRSLRNRNFDDEKKENFAKENKLQNN